MAEAVERLRATCRTLGGLKRKAEQERDTARLERDSARTERDSALIGRDTARLETVVFLPIRFSTFVMPLLLKGSPFELISK